MRGVDVAIDRRGAFATESRSQDGVARSILLIVAVLLGLGVVMFYSSTAAAASRDSDLALSWRPLMAQGMKLALGLVALFAGMWIPPAFFVRHSRKLLAVAFLLLVLVRIPGIGVEINGARRWIPLGSFYLQPMEVARVAVILWLASTIVRRGSRLLDFKRGLLPVAVVPALLAFLLLRQPDFGSAVFLLGLSVLMLILGGARATHFIALGLVAGVGAVGYAMRSLQHVQVRVQQFLHPETNAQALAARLALGSGGVSGLGLGAGMSKLGYLPMISSDFVLAAVGEELGLVGTSLVLLLFVALTFLMAQVAIAQSSRTGFLIAAGLTISIAVQVLINVAVVTGAAPTKGIALPFLSAGGSALACACFSIGLIVNLARRPDLPLDDAVGDRNEPTFVERICGDLFARVTTRRPRAARRRR